MPARTDRDAKTAKELFLEKAAAYFDDLNHAEACCITQERELLRNTQSLSFLQVFQ